MPSFSLNLLWNVINDDFCCHAFPSAVTPWLQEPITLAGDGLGAARTTGRASVRSSFAYFTHARLLTL